MLKSLLASILFLVLFQTQAQFTVGVEGAYSIYQQRLGPSQNYLVTQYKLNEKNSIVGAVCLRIHLTRRLAVEAKPFLSSLKSSIDYRIVYPATPYSSGSTSYYTAHLQYSYAHLPVLMEYYFTPGWYIATGPQMDVLRKANNSYNDLRDLSHYRLFDFVIDTGTELKSGIEVGISYTHALTDVAAAGDYDQRFERYTLWSFHVGVRLFTAHSQQKPNATPNPQ